MTLLMNKCIGTVARMGGVPAVLEDFVNSFIDLAIWSNEYVCGPGEYIHYPRPPRLSVHDVARNVLSESMRGDWLLQLDSDHAPEPDLLGRILNLANKTGADVVVGLYQFKSPPYSPVLYRTTEHGLAELGDWDTSVTALEIDSAGAGCLWVKRSVFDRIAAELKEKPFDRINNIGEDHSFFLRLKKLEIKAVFSPEIECPHLQTRAVKLEDYDRGSVELAAATPMKGYR